ncbi:site-specific integrase [Mycoavidus sp. HKI]|uniref:site-specific integrase n=1 Tax=Mycoavidus sp. HKI TaxID=2840467 RepID=UPI001CBC3004|nr:site-specific integrase [Mycoavidus sp. HKI]UAW64951.1 site-specific integrase [Mycoavidus sp. HKI]
MLKKLPDQARNLIQFAFWTGLRTSELIALDWADIDFSRECVKVYKAMTSAARGKAEDTKTRASRREVKILAPALAALNAQKKYTFLLESSAIFHNPSTHKRWDGDEQIRRTWKSAVKHAEARYRRPYQTRHTYASMMLSAGEHPMWVAQQMGHSDWTMIARRYGRWMPSADKEAGKKAVAIFAKKMLSECCHSDQK